MSLSLPLSTAKRNWFCSAYVSERGHAANWHDDVEPRVFLLHSSTERTVLRAGLLPWTQAPHRLLPEQQNRCKLAIDGLVKTAGQPNWDGAGADPVNDATRKAAFKVVEELPGDVTIPDISADPHGHIEFDWHLDNGTMFTISIGGTGDIAISGLCEGEGKLTSFQWDREGDLHLQLYSGLEWLRKMQNR